MCFDLENELMLLCALQFFETSWLKVCIDDRKYLLKSEETI